MGTESVYIDTWARKRQYDSLCANLGSGMNTHLMVLSHIFIYCNSILFYVFLYYGKISKVDSR